MVSIFLIVIYVAIVHAGFLLLLLYLLNFFLTSDVFQIISISPLFIIILKNNHFILTTWKCFLWRLLLCNFIFLLLHPFKFWVLLMFIIVLMMRMMMNLIIFMDYHILAYCIFLFYCLTLMRPKFFLKHLLNLQCLSLLLLLMIIHHLKHLWYSLCILLYFWIALSLAIILLQSWISRILLSRDKILAVSVKSSILSLMAYKVELIASRSIFSGIIDCLRLLGLMICMASMKIDRRI